MICSRGAVFYNSQHMPCELFYDTSHLLKHPLSIMLLGNWNQCGI
ncbi:hypothetical protein RintRC_6872 [Richelia intracellularis]|nr:hypothetical protein RintRC_6872 [Richelia intracellularis]